MARCTCTTPDPIPAADNTFRTPCASCGREVDWHGWTPPAEPGAPE
jgi:hypothetical protein